MIVLFSFVSLLFTILAFLSTHLVTRLVCNNAYGTSLIALSGQQLSPEKACMYDSAVRHNRRQGLNPSAFRLHILSLIHRHKMLSAPARNILHTSRKTYKITSDVFHLFCARTRFFSMNFKCR